MVAEEEEGEAEEEGEEEEEGEKKEGSRIDKMDRCARCMFPHFSCSCRNLAACSRVVLKLLL